MDHTTQNINSLEQSILTGMNILNGNATSQSNLNDRNMSISNVNITSQSNNMFQYGHHQDRQNQYPQNSFNMMLQRTDSSNSHGNLDSNAIFNGNDSPVRKNVSRTFSEERQGTYEGNLDTENASV